MHTLGNPYQKIIILGMCKSAISRIEAHRAQEAEVAIKKLMRPRKRFFLFGKQVSRTYEQAVTRLKTDDNEIFSSWSMIQAYGELWHSKATAIQAAAQTCEGNTVWLTVEEFNWIS